MAVLLSNILKYRDDATSASWSNILISVESSYPTSITGIVKGEGQNGMTAAILGTDYTTINDQLTTSPSYTWSVDKIQSTHNNLTPKIQSLIITTDDWELEENTTNVYKKNVIINNITNNTKVDLQADSTTLLLIRKSLISNMFIVNDNSNCTIYSIGNIPTETLTIQVACTEVII